MATGALNAVAPDYLGQQNRATDEYERAIRGAYGQGVAALNTQAQALRDNETDGSSKWFKAAAGFLGGTRSGHGMEGIGRGLEALGEGGDEERRQRMAQALKIGQIQEAQARLGMGQAKDIYGLSDDRLGAMEKAYKAKNMFDIYNDDTSDMPAPPPVSSMPQPSTPPMKTSQVLTDPPYSGVPGAPEQQGVPSHPVPAQRLQNMQQNMQQFGTPPQAPAEPVGGVSPAPAPQMPQRAPMPSQGLVGGSGDDVLTGSTGDVEMAGGDGSSQPTVDPGMVNYAYRIMEDYARKPALYEMNPKRKAALQSAQKIIELNKGSQSQEMQVERLRAMQEAQRARVEAALAKQEAKQNDPVNKELAKKTVEDLTKAEQGVRDAGDMVTGMDNIERSYAKVPDMLKGSVQGRLLGPVATMLGYDQELHRFATEDYLKSVEKMKGSISDKETGILQSAQISTKTDPESLKNIAAAVRASAARQRGKGEFLRMWYEKTGSTLGAEEAWFDYKEDPRNQLLVQDDKGNVRVNQDNITSYRKLFSQPTQPRSALPSPDAIDAELKRRGAK
jgi:hypothetical protein